MLEVTVHTINFLDRERNSAVFGDREQNAKSDDSVGPYNRLGTLTGNKIYVYSLVFKKSRIIE